MKVFLGETVQPPSSSKSPWPMVLATSLVGAATTWAFEELCATLERSADVAHADSVLRVPGITRVTPSSW